MRNLVQDGNAMDLPVGSALTAGTYTQVGLLNAVLESDADTSFNAVCLLSGVFDLEVVALGALAVGAAVYTADGIVIDDVNTGDLVGHLTAAIGGESTVTVNVRLHN